MPDPATDILEEATPRQELVGDNLRAGADWFHENKGDLFERDEAIESLCDELDVDEETADALLAELAGDTVDPVVHVETDDTKYYGVIDYTEFDDAYGYVDYHDVLGERKRVVCAHCVQEATTDTDVAHATAGDPSGQFADDPDATYDELYDAVSSHIVTGHTAAIDAVETGASLASGTTIGGNTSYHSGNYSGYSDSDARSAVGGSSLSGETSFDDGITLPNASALSEGIQVGSNEDTHIGISSNGLIFYSDEDEGWKFRTGGNNQDGYHYTFRVWPDGDADFPAGELSEQGDRVATRTWSNSNVNDHIAEDVHDQPQPPESHGSESHSSDVVHDGENATLGDTTHDSIDTDDAQVNNAPTEDTDVARKTEVDGKADTDANVEGFSTSGGADTVPVSQGDGTLQMEVVDTDTEIDLMQVQSTDELPDAENLDDPTIAYVNDNDEYVGVFQE